MNKISESFEEIIAEIDTLLTQRTLFREFQEVLKFNSALDAENPFIEMVIDCYVSDQCMRVRRLLDDRADSTSLIRLLTKFKPPQEKDKKLLQDEGVKIKKYATKWFAHRSIDREKCQAGFKHLDQIIDKLHQICLKYIRRHPDYHKIESPTLDIPFQENWRSIFYDPWIPDWKAFIKITNEKSG